MCTGAHAFIPAAKTAKVSLRTLQNGQQTENVFNVFKATGLSAGNVDEIANIVSLWWHDTYRLLLHNTVILSEVVVKDISTETGYEVVDTDHAGETGTEGDSPLPNQMAFKLKFSTAVSGRNGRGGPYVYGISLLNVSGNYANTDWANNVVGAWEELQSTLNSDVDGATLAIVSYCHANAWRAAALVTPVTGIGYTDLILDTQQRRKIGRGR